MHEVLAYLRDLAHRCVRLAQNSRDRQTAEELEGLGMEIMERTSEFEERF